VSSAATNNVPVPDPHVQCRSCRVAGYDVRGAVGPCPYDVRVHDDDADCPHQCCESCRRECAES
jgi:hypothetical protein